MRQPDTSALRERLASYIPGQELEEDKQELEGLLLEVNCQIAELRNLLQEINIHLILLTVNQQILINAKIYPLAYAFFKISVNTLVCLLKAIFFYQ